MWIPGLHRMILHSYSWIAISKNSTTSKNGMNVIKKEKCMSVKCSSNIEFVMDQSLTTSETTSLSIQLYLSTQLERSASPGRLMIFWEPSFHFRQELMPTDAAEKNHLNFNLYYNKTNIYFFCLFFFCNFLSWPSSCVSFRGETWRELQPDMVLCLKSWKADKYWDHYMSAYTYK